MGMSVGLLTVIILIVLVFHGGTLLAYYRYQQQLQPPHNITTTTSSSNRRVGEKGQKILHWILVLFMPISCILSIVATASCRFLTITIDDPFNPRNNDLEWGLGFSRFYLPLDLASKFGQDGGCEGLDTDLTSSGNNLSSLESGNSTAKTFAIFNSILTTICLILTMALTFKMTNTERRSFVYFIMKILMYISMFCCILTFYIQEESDICDDNPCSLGPHGILQVVNVILILIMVVILFVTDSGPYPYYRQCLISADEVYDRKVERGRKDPEFPART